MVSLICVFLRANVSKNGAVLALFNSKNFCFPWFLHMLLYSLRQEKSKIWRCKNQQWPRYGYFKIFEKWKFCENLLMLELWGLIFPGATKITWMFFYILMVNRECYWISEKNSCDHNSTCSCELSKTSKNQILINFKGLWSCCDMFSGFKTICLVKFHHRAI